ncbi:putative peptidase S1, PA clan [Helianthus annuus]|nr:putative peptidase S1, PA clan [Helianthus annuus]KAJ0574791.1 putative peptidase S1, PA clan [Helianthus annuus]KAJ0739122.1 putative peptidase S1, PA clan [Helianthus annuus]
MYIYIFRVILADQTTYDAKVVGFDQDKDVAVLRIDAPKDKLRPILVGVSADLLVGQSVCYRKPYGGCGGAGMASEIAVDGVVYFSPKLQLQEAFPLPC